MRFIKHNSTGKHQFCGAPRNFILLKAIFIGLSTFLIVSCVTEPVTGDSALVLTSLSQEKELGSKAWGEVLAKHTEIRDTDSTRTLRDVATSIVEQTEMKDLDWEFALLDSETKNAFALPGGKIAVYQGMFQTFRNTAELAAVLGHEVAHVTARHGGQRLTLSLGENLVLQSVGMYLKGTLSPDRQNLLLTALGLGAQVGLNMPFSRSHESDADYIGLIYMARAGFHPQAAIDFWTSFGSTPPIPEFLSTHPHPSSRVEGLKKHMPEAMQVYRSHSQSKGYGEPLAETVL